MFKQIWQKRLVWGKVLIVGLVVLAIAASVYTATAAGQVSDQETLVLGQTEFSPGTPAALRVVVRDFKTTKPVANAVVAVKMQPQAGGKALTLYEGRTDDAGTAQVQFTVPEGVDPQQTLVVETRSSKGTDRVEQAVRVERDYKLLLTTDKPLYQPGQTIHIRALALSTADLRAACSGDGDCPTVEFTIEDPKGNKLLRETATPSEYGISDLDFTLAETVNSGLYKITALMGETESERTATVKPYVLPKFQVALETERAYYLPGQTVRGTVRADYFFGKPVAGGEVRMRGYIYAVEREEVLDLRGETDEAGRYEFEFDLPQFFVGGQLEGEQAAFGLEVTVIDQAEHAEAIAQTVPVAQEPILIEAVAESGTLRPGVENIVYLLTAYPDGAPAERTLVVATSVADATELTSGRHGLAEFRFTPQQGTARLSIAAQDAQGNSVSRILELQSEWTPETVLLRPERAAYQVGETMHLDAFTSPPSVPPGRGEERGVDAVYLDIIKEGQTISTRALEVQNGRAQADVDLDETLFGTLTIHAYKILSDGTIVRDTRLVVVTPSEGIELAVTSDQETYRPGDLATVAFRATKAGQPLQSAIGVSIVDESVFALAEQEAGFARLYFLLEKELLEPRYQITGLTLPDLTAPLPVEAEVREAQDRTAKAALAQSLVLSAVEGSPTDRRSVINSRPQKIQAVKTRQASYFQTLAQGFGGALVLVSLAMGVIALVVLWRRRVLGRTLLLTVLTVLALIGLLSLLPGPPWRGGASLLDKLEYYLSEGMGSWVLLLISLGLAALIGLIVHAWRGRDEGLKYAFVLMLAYAVLLPLTINAVNRGDWSPSDAWVLTLGLSLLLIPVSFLLRGIGFGVERRGWLAAAGVGAGLLLFTPLLLFPILAVGGMGASAPQNQLLGLGDRGGPMVIEERVVVEKEVMVEKPMMATPMPAPSVEAGGPQAQEAPRLRQFFPETLYWNPQAITDGSGFVELEIPMADSITTWRLSALASSQGGDLGSVTAGLRVFQDFFVDLDLPLYLTQNDEVAVPVAVYNYLPEPQRVRLELEPADWYELQEIDVRAVQPARPNEKEIIIGENDVEVVYFRIKARQFGTQALQVTAWGEQPALSGAEGMSDAIRREVRVMPDGKEFQFAITDRLEESTRQVINLPTDVIPGTARIEVKVYPGFVSQVVEGIGGLLRMPFG